MYLAIQKKLRIRIKKINIKVTLIPSRILKLYNLKMENVLIKELRGKLEKKAFENAFLYFQTMDYQAALIAFKDVLRDFPESQYKEDVLYWMLVTNYEVAIKSVKNKKQERFEDTINSYYKFVDTFPESRKINQAEKYYKISVKQLEIINS